MINGKKIEIIAYNLETMIVEKLETLYRRDIIKRNRRHKGFLHATF